MNAPKQPDHERDNITLGHFIGLTQRLADIDASKVPEAREVLKSTLKRIESVSQRLEPIGVDETVSVPRATPPVTFLDLAPGEALPYKGCIVTRLAQIDVSVRFAVVDANNPMNGKVVGVSSIAMPRAQVIQAIDAKIEAACAQVVPHLATTPRRPKRDDGFLTRNDVRYWTGGERAIQDAVDVVERMGASTALTECVTLLGKARDRLADHVETAL